MVLGLLAHAYFHLSPTRPAPPPPAIAAPWAEVCRRLGRSGPYLSYVDLVVCNWRLRDPAAADPMRVDNLRLLVPTVDNEEEHIFHLTQTEILARTAPVVAAAVRIGDAIRRDDPDGVADSLATITAALRKATRSSLPTINPRPGSRSYVDPVVWARTVAPFAVPIAPGALGPSGTAAPLFNLLDSLFQRPTQRSQLGREILGHRAAYPQHWRRFLTAVDAVALGLVSWSAAAIRSFATRSARPSTAYAGADGFLSRHRRKVFGYLEIAFKVGRGVTIGGFSGRPAGPHLDPGGPRTGEVPGRTRRGCSRPHRARAVRKPPAAASTETSFPLSELVLHNDDDHGYWISIDREIYDVTEFLRRHPGGPMVLQGYAGRDATQAYHRLHSASTAAAVALGRCRIGSLRTPESWRRRSSTAANRDRPRGFSTHGPTCSSWWWRCRTRCARTTACTEASANPASPRIPDRRTCSNAALTPSSGSSCTTCGRSTDAATDRLWPVTAAAAPDVRAAGCDGDPDGSALVQSRCRGRDGPAQRPARPPHGGIRRSRTNSAEIDRDRRPVQAFGGRIRSLPGRPEAAAASRDTAHRAGPSRWADDRPRRRARLGHAVDARRDGRAIPRPADATGWSRWPGRSKSAVSPIPANRTRGDRPNFANSGCESTVTKPFFGLI